MSKETRGMFRPITMSGIESIEKRIKILFKKKVNAAKYKDELAVKNLEKEIAQLEERKKTRKLKQDA